MVKGLSRGGVPHILCAMAERGREVLVSREHWDERYGTEELIWKADPNRFLVEELGRSRPRHGHSTSPAARAAMPCGSPPRVGR